MFISIALLVVSLLLILLAAEGFTNGVEILGKRLSFSQAVVGSVLAAVGTALPETILPLVAIFAFRGNAAEEIGVGAILGAPFMLSTLAFFLIGITVIVRSVAQKRPFELTVEPRTARRDLAFFILMYAVAVIEPLLGLKALALPLAVLLVIGYVIYVKRTAAGESAEIEHFEGLHIWNFWKKIMDFEREHPHLSIIILQVAGAIAVMVMGAHLFVHHLERISVALGMNPLLFALLLAPVATELPEKFNSVTWLWKGKDALAFGNITGAMVFQATFPVSVGLLFTDWKIEGMGLVSAVMALLSASVVLIGILWKKKVSPYTVLLGGALYLVYAALLVLGR